ncbi:MAG: AAA family ATPase, partial [Bacteroidales bacterium]|nr:AAA family ATPase [Bacteroidales bacterium]
MMNDTMRNNWRNLLLPVEFYLTTSPNEFVVLNEVDVNSEKLYVRMNIVCRQQVKELNMDIYIWTKAKDADGDETIIDGIQCGDITTRGKYTFRDVKPNEILRLEAEFPLDKGVKKDCVLHLEFMGSDIFLFPFKLGSTNQEVPDFNRDAKIAKYLLLDANDREWAKPEAYSKGQELESMLKIREMFVPKELTDFLEKQLRLHTFNKHYNSDIKQPQNLNVAFYGKAGIGKKTMVQLYADFLYETGMFSSKSVHTENGNTLRGERFIDSEWKPNINIAIDKAKNNILHIRNADEMLVKHTDENSTHDRDSPEFILQQLINGAKNNNMVLILTGSYPEIPEMLNFAEELRQLIPNTFRFDNLSVDALMSIAGKILQEQDFSLSDEAHATLKKLVADASVHSGKNFQNAKWLKELLDATIVNTKNRAVEQYLLDDYFRSHCILPEDIPQTQPKSTGKAMDKLRRMTGLTDLKQSIADHLNQVWLNKKRRQQGMHSQTGPLHMLFLGNPGTGKTTVANLIGEIYHNMGILSSGHVVSLDITSLTGRFRGHTEAQTRIAIKRAQGGVLFIDEAYSLFSNSGGNKEDGTKIIDALMPMLGHDDADMIVILAGYPAEMELLMNSNSGLRSRFPNVFNFADYNAEELLQIADRAAEDRDLVFSPEARKKFEKLVGKAYNDRDAYFGNARYVVRMLQTNIIPKMSTRLAKYKGELDVLMLKTILPEDIPAAHKEKPAGNTKFEEERIDKALQSLDEMIGLQQVKTAIHNFVKLSRMMNSQGKTIVGKTPLKWSFTGNTGTGKSTVAEIFAEILHGMKILERGQIVEVNAEEIYEVSAWQAEERLKTAMYRSRQGLLFIDSDAPKLKQRKDVLDSEQLRIKLAG